MSIVTLTEAKNHLRVSDTTDDAIIQVYIDAARDHIRNYLNVANPPQSAAIKAAALLLIGDFYENREAASEKTYNENPAVVRLLYPYRKEIGI
jgi:hypothetical protein